MTRSFRPALSRRRFLQGTGIAAAAVATNSWPAVAAADPVPDGVEAPSGRSFDLVLDEGWDSIDNSLWYRYWSTYGDSNNCQDYLRPRNVQASDGTLKIITKREKYEGPQGERDFTSGFISTSRRGPAGTPQPDSETYFPREGYFEMRGKVTHAHGIWNGCWLRHRHGSSEAEVDILETLHAQGPGKTSQALHLNISGDAEHNVLHEYTRVDDPQGTPDWHTWGVLIHEEDDDVRFRFYTDGEESGTYLAKSPDFWHKHSEDKLWDFSLNTHTGGSWVGHPDDNLGYSRYVDQCLSSGEAPNCDTTGINRSRISDRSKNPGDEVFEISYVRIWELD